MTEAEARAALRAFVDIGDVKRWIGGRPWQAMPGRWTVGASRRRGSCWGRDRERARARRLS